MAETEEPEASNTRYDKLFIEAITAQMSRMVDAKLEAFRKETSSTPSADKGHSEVERDGNRAVNNKRNHIRPSPVDDDLLHSIHDEEATDYYGSDRSLQSHRTNRRVRQEAPQQSNAPHGLKLKIPAFHGKSDPDAYLEWEKKIELVFECQYYTEESKVRYAATEFYDYALSWWDQLVTTRRKNGELPIRSWRKMKQLLRKRFVPNHYHRELHTRLRNLSQGTKTVDEYYQELETLMLRADIEESNEATMSRFLGGLNRDLIDLLEVCDYLDIEELLHKAVMYEKQLKRKGTRSSYNSSRSSYAKDTRIGFQKDFKSNVKAEDKSFVSKEFKPSGSKDSKEPAKSNARARDVKCFKCHGLGHYASACPNNRIILLRADGEFESEDEKTDESSDAEGELPLKGPLLVTMRALSVLTKDSEQEQRENLFHTRCMVKDKICSVIIDGGSCTNVASKTMVQKLKLKELSHPRPYKLQWLNDDGELQVKKQVRVPMSIGKYHDEILCDVLPMEACHLLLGRPWQSDRRVIHDRFSNKHSF